MYVRYLEDNIIPKTAFVALKALEKADASSIHAALVSTLEEELEISDWKDRLVSGCFDGAAVNLGCKSGVVVRLEKDVPELIAIHCCSHRLELAVKAVVKEVPFYKTVNTFLVDLYKAYHDSALMWSGLRIEGDAFKITILKPQKAYGTRWLPHHERVITAVLRDYPALVQHLGEVAVNGSTQATKESAQKLTKALKNIRFVAFLHFMDEYLTLMSSLSRVFQSNDPTVDCVNSGVESISSN